MAQALRQHGRTFTLAAITLTLVACAEPDDSIGSQLAQPAAGMPKQEVIEGGDIALVGEKVAHAIMDLPAVADAPMPPLVRFKGVTSIVDQPIDTEPYTDLLRDRLLLLTREKLRFVEHTLPPLITKKSHHEGETTTPQNTTDPDFEVLAELRGRAERDTLKVQVEFVDAHTHDILFNGLYAIRREADAPPPAMPMQAPDMSAPPAPQPEPPAPSPTQMAPPTTNPGVL